MPELYKFLDLKDKRKVYAVGDIHGCFTKLDTVLKKLDFDYDQDFLISVGDLVDRGPENHLAKDYVKQPWFQHVIGNHEELAKMHLDGDSYVHSINGGGWLSEEKDKVSHVDALMDASYLLEVHTRNGHRCGFVHADLPYNDWKKCIAEPDLKTFTWSRERIRLLRNPHYEPTISNIDKVFFGHNALLKPTNRGNCFWIDTGSGFEDGKLTVMDIETERYVSL